MCVVSVTVGEDLNRERGDLLDDVMCVIWVKYDEVTDGENLKREPEYLLDDIMHVVCISDSEDDRSHH